MDTSASHPASLSAAPPQSAPAVQPPAPGRQMLGVEAERDAMLYLPAGREADLPLLVLLHGAGGDAAGGLSLLEALADEYGIALLAPASRGSTWDAVGRSRYGADVEVIDRALEKVFTTVPVDPEKIAVGGFSDGASYALGLGLANGGLFHRILAFSPGFIPSGPRSGKPFVFVSHGDADDVLPRRNTSARLVPELREDGYDVEYVEFSGGHAVPPVIARQGLDWLQG